jgi:hypothetical protein
MYDAKNFDDVKKEKDTLRCECIGDRAYFRQIQYESTFEFKTAHIPVENIIK